MKALIIIFLIILLVIIVFNIPIKIYISYDKSLKIYMKYTFFRYNIVPSDEKAELPKKQKSTKEKKKKEAKKSNSKITYDVIMIILNKLPKLGNKISKMLSKIIFDDTILYLVVSGNDAHDTSTKYTKITAWIFALYATLDNIFKMKKVHLCIEPDYTLGGYKFSTSTVVKIRPAILVTAFLGSFIVIIETYFEIRKYHKILGNYTEKTPYTKNPDGRVEHV